ncbi:enoyl-CoA hydratase-related protein [Gammaproteobacteria bacterium]|nr:enoyl-CoA hydratase-related protein [Gammaproteobacteria bacterium]MDC0576889.1 enoyl-CoA hydratase-related protein [Gammaproteobacteria bacterium]MDC0590959.1 enoyl-CoA hydratase-related protein [Gammaproteobacteria bacterium]MDC3323826.1 enoyl-CoA hydratase-related protein [Gammaproteobacteria bacterium]
MKYEFIECEELGSSVRRIYLNRPEKRNALCNPLRKELFDCLNDFDEDPEVKAIIIAGRGSCFCAGYDLSYDNSKDLPFHASKSDGFWPRHVVEGAFKIWDLSTPVIAEVHGYCLAGGTELAASCDLVYVTEDAEIGYPVVRSMSPPDNQFFPWLLGMRNAMEMMLTGESISGVEAAEKGFANRAFTSDLISHEVEKIAFKVAQVPSDIQAINKRSIHRQMEIMGMRDGIRAGTELQALAMHSRSTKEHLKELSSGLKEALTKRDKDFGDYRTKDKK